MVKLFEIRLVVDFVVLFRTLLFNTKPPSSVAFKVLLKVSFSIFDKRAFTLKMILVKVSGVQV